MARLPVLGFLALALAFGGCGGSDSGSAGSVPPCSIKVALSGDFTAKGDGSELACAFTDTPPGPTSATIVLAMSDISFSLIIDNFSEGITGDFPATVFIGNTTSGGQWATTAGSCSVSVTKDTKKTTGASGRIYQLVGSGKCSEAAGSLTGSAPVDIGDFTFTAQIAWKP